MKTPSRLSLPRTLPMPLWLQGAIEVLVSVAATLVVLTVLLAVGWFSLDTPGGVVGLVLAAGQLWLAAHGVGLHLDVPSVGGAPAAEGTAELIPLGLTLVLLLANRRAGARLARASYEGEFWKPVLGGLVAYALCGALVAVVTGTEASAASVPVSAVLPLWVPLLGMVWGGHRVSGSWLRLVGISPETLARRYSQYTRWAGAYALSLVRAAWVGALALLAGGALLVGVSIFWHWNVIVAMYQSLHAGVAGDFSLLLLQLIFLPNLVVMGLGWATGAGFSLGQGTLISPASAHPGAVPALPVLGAVPETAGPFAFAVLVIPVLAGALAAWWFVRAGEDHLDEWLSLKIRVRAVSAALSGLVFAVLLGALVGGAAAALALVSHGSLGIGSMTDIGPHAGSVFCWAAATTAAGALVGRILGPWLERDERAAEDAPRSRGERSDPRSGGEDRPVVSDRKTVRNRTRKLRKGATPGPGPTDSETAPDESGAGRTDAVEAREVAPGEDSAREGDAATDRSTVPVPEGDASLSPLERMRRARSASADAAQTPEKPEPSETPEAPETPQTTVPWSISAVEQAKKRPGLRRDSRDPQGAQNSSQE